ncbi:MAG TPA: hypothetical protein VGB98_07930 [Pyrinomonadaceae bacterium]
MRNILSAPETATRTRVLFALAALLLCAGQGRAQERNDGETSSPRRLTVNVKPFEDLAMEGKLLVERGKLGPDTTLDVSATAERAEDGRLKPESVQVSWHTPADETLATLARHVLTAFSESRVLSAFDGVTAVRLGLKLDRQNVSVTVACETPAESDARKYADGYGMMIKIAVMSKKGTAEGRLYESLGFTSEGKVFKMSFEMPRDEAARMIAEMLARRAAKAAGQRD